MALQILPAEYQTPPNVAQNELEDLILQVEPAIEDRPDYYLKATAQLRAAVEALLLAYRQSVFLSTHRATLLPADRALLQDSVTTNYDQAWTIARAMRSVGPAFELFITNMNIEEESDFSARLH